MEAIALQPTTGEAAMEGHLLKPHNDLRTGEEAPDQSLKRKRDDADNKEAERTANEDFSNGGVQRQPYWKTSLCSYFRRDAKSCRHGDSCRYAHGEDELRIRPDNTWDPTSMRAKGAQVSDVTNGAGAQEEEQGGKGEEDSNEEEDDEPDEVASGEVSNLEKCVMGIPMKWTLNQFKHFLTEQGIQYEKATKKRKLTVGFVRFENKEQLEAAVKKLTNKTIGGRVINIGDPIRKKHQPSKSGSFEEPKSARDAACPLAHMPYSEQLEQKKGTLSQLLKKLTRNVRKACPSAASLPEWISKSREIGGLPCPLEGILPSPVINGYRNKCEFSVGYSRLGRKTVGFMSGSFREGNATIEEAVDCPHISPISCKYATMFQDFLQSSTLPVWNKLNNSGFWRQFTVREGRNPGQFDVTECAESEIAEVMLFVQVCSLGVDKELMDTEIQQMTKSFVEGANSCSPPLPLTVLAIQDNRGVSDSAPVDSPILTLIMPDALTVPEVSGTRVSGCQGYEAIIHDYICNLKFSISPTAFFQVNTLAAEKLYTLAGDWACLSSNTLLFDICCGTGAIGLTLAHRVGMVVGIEMNNSAVSDAARNAEANGIRNCKFICAKAEDVMGAVFDEYLDRKKQCSEAADNDCDSKKNECDDGPSPNFEDVVAIVDPPRAGLHPTVIKAIRTHPRVRRLVYISCNPESLAANAIELCTPTLEKPQKAESNHWFKKTSIAGFARRRVKSMPNSEPFRPVRAVAVDLFPHTPHCEMVMLFER